MKRLGSRRIGVGIGVAALAAVGLTGASAQAGGERATETATINIVLEGKDMFFDGPGRIEAGTKLEIVNLTDPQEVGPHTFSLVKRSALPETKEEVKGCEKKLEGACGKIFKAHKVNFEKETVGKLNVDAGGKGWDTSFGKKGDSWFTFAEDESETRKLTADAGKKLWYLCAIHPFMQGKITVE